MVFDNGEAACGDTCIDGTCFEDEVCELVPVVCVTEPCNFPAEAFCSFVGDFGEEDDESFSFSYDFIDFGFSA